MYRPFPADRASAPPRCRSVHLVLLLLAPLFGGCLGQMEDGEVGATVEGLTAAERRARAGDIRDAAAARGMTQGWLLAGIADAETTMSHCWSELTWSCQGPTSPDCGGPIVAGAADGPCSDRQGGLGMFQFDAGTYEDTLAREGSRILTVAGNTDAAVDFVIDMVIRSEFVSGVDDAASAVAWMNGVRPEGPTLEQWAQTVTRYYNGCRTTASCWSERLARYRRFAVNVHAEMGAGFWDVAGTGGGGGTGGGTTTDVAYAAEFVTQSFPRIGSPFTLAPGEERYGYFELQNAGTDSWTPGFTFLGTVEPRDGESPLYGPDWTAPHRAASVESEVAPGEIGRFGLTVRAPLEEGEYQQAFNLVEEGVGFFTDVGRAPRDGDIAIRINVSTAAPTPDGDGGVTGGGEPPGTEPPGGTDPPPAGHPGAGGVTGGCSVGSPREGVGPLSCLTLVLLWSRRRRARPGADRAR